MQTYPTKAAATIFCSLPIMMIGNRCLPVAQNDAHLRTLFYNCLRARCACGRMPCVPLCVNRRVFTCISRGTSRDVRHSSRGRKRHRNVQVCAFGNKLGAGVRDTPIHDVLHPPCVCDGQLQDAGASPVLLAVSKPSAARLERFKHTIRSAVDCVVKGTIRLCGCARPYLQTHHDFAVRALELHPRDLQCASCSVGTAVSIHITLVSLFTSSVVFINALTFLS